MHDKIKITVIRQFPPSLFDKLLMTANFLDDIILTIDKYHKQDRFGGWKCYRSSELHRKYSYLMLLAIDNIISNQVSVLRKLAFPNEYKPLKAWCFICKRERNFITVDFDRFILQQSLRKCTHCHLVDHTFNLVKIKPKPSGKNVLSYIESKPALASYLSKIQSYSNACTILMYYNKQEKHLKSLTVNEFFINIEVKGKKCLMCPACKKIYKRVDMAKIHFKYFWEYNWQKSCMKGVQANKHNRLADM